jgi:hypothetical protein
MDGKNVGMDFIGKDGTQGQVASVFAGSGLNVNQMRPYLGKDGRAYITVYKGGDAKDPTNYASVPIQTNATLRRDEWVRLDEAVLRIAESRLGGVQDLVTRGLVYDIGDGMGSTVLEYHDVSDALEADLTMDGVSRARGDRPNYSANYLPLPIIHADYELNARVLAASRNLGQPLDTTLAERASRKVSEKLENLLFTDTTYAFGGGTIYSLMNHPNRNKKNLTKAWSTPATGSEIITDVLAMKQEAIAAHHYGPWVLYIPTAYETIIDRDYDSTRGNTIRERILAISGIEDVKVIDTLPANTVLLVQMTSDVVRLVRGMGIQNVEWQTEGGLITKYKVMTIQVPQVRADQDGNSGIVHGGISIED